MEVKGLNCIIYIETCFSICIFLFLAVCFLLVPFNVDESQLDNTLMTVH